MDIGGPRDLTWYRPFQDQAGLLAFLAAIIGGGAAVWAGRRAYRSGQKQAAVVKEQTNELRRPTEEMRLAENQRDARSIFLENS
jgi:hypothetical protein